jgi:arginase
MAKEACILLGVPVQEGAGRAGCDKGPQALRRAGLAQALENLGHQVVDAGDLTPAARRAVRHGNTAIKALPEIVAWTETIADAAYQFSADGVPILLGGDHSLAAGALSGLSRRSAERGREFFVLWLDAHPDFHTLDTTRSGNLHGVPLAYATGQSGFDGIFPPLCAPVKAENICMMGVRSVDQAERAALAASSVLVHDMRDVREYGVAPLLDRFLKRVSAVEGVLHVSLDVDFLDPGIAPGVGTPVPGGATMREARLIMETLRASELVRSLDLVELNPALDERGRATQAVVDLAASLMGRPSAHRPLRSTQSWRKSSISCLSSASIG